MMMMMMATAPLKKFFFFLYSRFLCKKVRFFLNFSLSGGHTHHINVDDDDLDMIGKKKKFQKFIPSHTHTHL